MKKFHLVLNVIILIFGSLVFGSCSKEHATPKDMITNIMGTYSYTLKLHSISTGSLRYLGKSNDKTGIFLLKENAMDQTRIDFWEGNKLLLYGNQLVKVEDYITFKIPTQKREESGNIIDIVGYEGVFLGTLKYQVTYSVMNEKLNGYFRIEGSPIVVSVESYKL